MSPACLTLLALADLYPWEEVSRIPLELILLPRCVWQGLSFVLSNIFSWGLIHDRKLTTGLPRRWLSQLAKPKVLQWIEMTRGPNGSWKDSAVATGIISLGQILSEVPAKQVAPGLSYLLATQRADGSWAGEEDLAFSVTTYILGGLENVGLLDHPRLEATRAWLLASQHDEPFAPTGSPGGWWSWRLPSGWPDSDDTAGAITVLRCLGVPTSHPQLQKGCDWLCKMQNRDGSWNMFVKEAHTLVDKPCPALTARAMLALHNCREAPGRARYLSAIDRALGYLRRTQQEEGAFKAFWFKRLVYGTAQVLEVYALLNRASEPVARKCSLWLRKHQHADGSWGRSDDDVEGSGTVEETAWALAALAAPGVNTPDGALDRAATWLIQQQCSDGSWSPSVVGHFTPAFSYSSNHIANGFALQALGRYHRLRRI